MDARKSVELLIVLIRAMRQVLRLLEDARETFEAELRHGETVPAEHGVPDELDGVMTPEVRR